MSASFTKMQQLAAGIVLFVVGALLAGATSGAKTREADDDVKLVRTEKLANAPGQTLTAVTVNYAPGGTSRGHHHAGSVFAYVLTGAIRSENSATGPVKVYKAGESFFEPPGSKHLISENASATEPASLLAVFVADDGAQLTTFDSARSAPPADKDLAKQIRDIMLQAPGTSLGIAPSLRKGIVCEGTFTASCDAATLSKVAHFHGASTAVTVRFL
jgi:quercetin dioxygenase-like cupin family protein